MGEGWEETIDSESSRCREAATMGVITSARTVHNRITMYVVS